MRRVRQLLADVPTNIQTRALHRRVVARLKDARPHATLDRLADRPVLPIYEVPELHRVRRVEIRLGHLIGMKEELVDDRGTVRRLGPHVESRDVLGGEAEHEVGIYQLALVAHPLILVETGKRRPVGRAARREGPGSLAMGNAALPVELGAAPLLERRDQPAELGMHRTAVVALVVVLQDDFPVGLDHVGDPVGRPAARRADTAAGGPEPRRAGRRDAGRVRTRRPARDSGR